MDLQVDKCAKGVRRVCSNGPQQVAVWRAERTHDTCSLGPHTPPSLTASMDLRPPPRQAQPKQVHLATHSWWMACTCRYSGFQCSRR